MKIDHIGIVVKDLNLAIAEYQKLYNAKVSDREKFEDRNVELAFIEFANTSVELLSPISFEQTETALVKTLNLRGPGLHHICYEVSDIIAELSKLKAQGIELIDEKPRKGARGSIIAFFKPQTFDAVLVELCQY